MSSQIEQALGNLEQIRAGEDPRETTDSVEQDTNEIEIYERNELPYRHDEIRRTRSEIDDAFVRAVNLIEPEHPFIDDPYPITLDDVRLSYCQESSRIWAKCGPMYERNSDVVQFSVDRKTVGRFDRERYYNVLVHELTHITEGSHSEGSIHNPRFWRQMADNAVVFVQNWPGPVDVDRFVSYCRNEPNRSMTDRRSKSVGEQRQAVEDRIVSQLSG